MVLKSPNSGVTRKLLDAVEQHGESEVMPEFDGILESGDMHWSEFDLTECLRKDLGADWRGNARQMSQNALEATITSGTFVKFAEKLIRFGLRETPREEYVLLNRVSAETKGECERAYRDKGIFSDPETEEVRELQAPPSFGLASDFMDHPEGSQRGLGFEYTREALCEDPNGYLAQQLPKLADAHNRHWENQLLDALIGYRQTYNRTGTAYSTFYGPDAAVTTPFPSGAGGPWINAMRNDINCPSDFQAVKDYLYDFRDLFHGRPVTVPTDNLTIMTSPKKRDEINPRIRAGAVEHDGTSCDGGSTTYKYISTHAVAANMDVTLQAYQRLADRIVLRYGVTRAEAEKWMWFGSDINAFIGLVYQIRPEVTRINISGEMQEKRIVAKWTSLSKGYSYVKDPMRGFMCTPTP